MDYSEKADLAEKISCRTERKQPFHPQGQHGVAYS